ncbi:hypothetical protein LTR02_004738 [Friedmanniomyces endolithicus]|nr:hypothetical protein LTR94_016124 [Friedmanniomyces endolithicus]KAK0815499.1 hypothetical protein LTR59_000572 [Friedmanniomyces endolithicus]KAK0818287.1 hypothetical protein LTR38_001334 [Friedmanniomyces endolithicus]KAK0819375.1 hypothetical protein LTR75_002144 [Friedmanniomyces endolithicus]KAK0845410.1 hypothetical protein LTR03_007467 [Friedmanniomyces endolithicus]
MDDVWGQEPFVSSDDASLEYTSTTAMSSQTLEDIVASFDLSSSSYANAETSSPSSCKLEHLAEQLVTCDLQHTTDGRGASSEQSHAMTYQPDQSAMPGYNEHDFEISASTLYQAPNPTDAQQDIDWNARLQEVQRFVDELEASQEGGLDVDRSMFHMPSPIDVGGGDYYQHEFAASGNQGGYLDGSLASSESPLRVQPKPSPTNEASDGENARGSSRRKAGSDDDLIAPRKRRRAVSDQSPAANTPSVLPVPSVNYDFSLSAQTPGQSTSNQAPVVPAMTTADGSVFATNLAFPLGNRTTHIPMPGTASVGPTPLAAPPSTGHAAANSAGTTSLVMPPSISYTATSNGGTTSLMMPPSTGNAAINTGGTLFVYPGNHVTPSGKTRINAYNFGFKDGPGDTVNLFHGLTGGVELLVLFPNHTKWPQVMLRLLGSGWTTKEMAAAQLYARGGSQGNLKRRFATMRKQATTPSIYPSTEEPGTTPTANSTGIPPVRDYDATAYLPVPKKVSKLHSMILYDIGRDIVNFPTHDDRGLLTQAVQWAMHTGDMTATTDDIQGLAQHHGWTYPADAGTNRWDQRGRTRMMVILRAAGWAV